MFAVDNSAQILPEQSETQIGHRQMVGKDPLGRWLHSCGWNARRGNRVGRRQWDPISPPGGGGA